MGYRYDDMKMIAERLAADNPVAAGAVYAAYEAGVADLAEAMKEHGYVPDALAERMEEAHEAMKRMTIRALAMAMGSGKEDSE